MDSYPTKSCDIVIFGAHGDLAFRKLMPALYHLVLDNYIDKDSRIIAVVRDDMSLEEHIALVEKKLQEFLIIDKYDAEFFEVFKKQLFVTKVDFPDKYSYKDLQSILSKYPTRDRINYLSTAPHFFGTICENLSLYDLIIQNSRVVLEKPIGRSLKSSQVINQKVLEFFDEKQIFRIDHYLGKDTVQNILALRFSNRIFMPLWDGSNIDHVQITVAESVGVEDRWGYYDEYGALRDMIQNHLLQLLCLVAMEPPCSLDGDSVRDEKVKVLRSIRKMNRIEVENNTVRAQYKAGSIDGKPVPGYLEGDSVGQSTTETFAAMRVDIDNWRWNNVPFYIRSGKRMSNKNSEIVIHFKHVPHSIFPNNGKCLCENQLIISLQPKESITLKMMHKIPGVSATMRLQEVELELNAPELTNRKPEAYERLLLDVIQNNPTLFMRLDEVESAWQWADNIIEAWADDIVPMKSYPAGTDGPASAINLIAKDGRNWYEE
jgi:glucose-6-phosphate 1-dehydrogenase